MPLSYDKWKTYGCYTTHIGSVEHVTASMLKCMWMNIVIAVCLFHFLGNLI